MEITVGADPEVFVSKNGSFFPAIGLVPGTKTDPFKVEKGAVQVDGLALEFNIDPAKSYEEFQENIDVVSTKLRSMVPDYEFMKTPAITLSRLHKAIIPKKDLMIGCSADFNAYSEELNDGPPQDSDVRAAGGHVHIGGFFTPHTTTGQKYALSCRLARLMDRYVGVYSVLWDKDDLRRKIYGKAGACRLKNYGIEYRTLSNQWIFSKTLTKFVYDQTIKAVNGLMNDEDVHTAFFANIINNSDRKNSYFDNRPELRELLTA
jgi:hypothetical protein